jgi:TPR repeat protein
MKKGIFTVLAMILLVAGCATTAHGPLDDYNAGNYQKAFQGFLPLAQQGDRIAEYHVGYMYEHGQGVKKDYVTALSWLKKSADVGYADAQFETGYMYDNGLGIAQDYQEAYRWYKEAADQGNTMAINNIGWMCQQGNGVPRDYKRAMEWYLKASKRGNGTASTNIGQMYLNGFGVPQDQAEGIKWYKTASDQGDIWADLFLANAYLHGKYGVSRSVTTWEFFLKRIREQRAKDWQQLVEIIHEVINARKFYPEPLVKYKVSGTVYIGFDYQYTRPFNITVEKSSGIRMLDDVAWVAVKRSVFPAPPAPLKKKVHFVVPMTYTLQAFSAGGQALTKKRQ